MPKKKGRSITAKKKKAYPHKRGEKRPLQEEVPYTERRRGRGILAVLLFPWGNDAELEVSICLRPSSRSPRLRGRRRKAGLLKGGEKLGRGEKDKKTTKTEKHGTEEEGFIDPIFWLGSISFIKKGSLIRGTFQKRTLRVETKMSHPQTTD